jgi:hypothetical protein
MHVITPTAPTSEAAGSRLKDSQEPWLISGPGGRWCSDQNPSGSLTKIAVIRPVAIALLMTRTLFTPLETP